MEETDRFHLVYGQGYVIPSVGNLTKEKYCVNKFEFTTGT
jgi:hypothetical protein